MNLAAWIEFVVYFTVCCGVGSLVFAIAGLAIPRMGCQRATTRHSMQLLATLCLLASPLAIGCVITLAPAMAESSARQGVAENTVPYLSSGQAGLGLAPASTDAQNSASRSGSASSMVGVPHRVAKVWLAGSFTKSVIVGFGLLWVSGSLLSLWSLVKSLLGVRRLIRTSTRADASIVESAVSTAAASFPGFPIPRVRSSELVSAPQVAGFFRPVILLPASDRVLQRRGELAQVLLHELAHIVRKDQMAVLVQRVVVFLFWWNPLVHRLMKRLDDTREQLCDNVVLRNFDGVSYGETLLRFAMADRTKRTGLLVAFLGTRGAIEQRIAEIVDPERDLSTRAGFVPNATGIVLFAGLFILVCSTMVPSKGYALTRPAVESRDQTRWQQDSPDAPEVRMATPGEWFETLSFQRATPDRIEVRMFDEKLMAIDFSGADQSEIEMSPDGLKICGPASRILLKVELDLPGLHEHLQRPGPRVSGILRRCRLAFSSANGFIARFEFSGHTVGHNVGQWESQPDQRPAMVTGVGNGRKISIWY